MNTIHLGLVDRLRDPLAFHESEHLTSTKFINIRLYIILPYPCPSTSINHSKIH